MSAKLRAFCTTVHDPEGRLAPFLTTSDAIDSGFDSAIFASVTTLTAPETIARLRGLGVTVATRDGADIGRARTEAVAGALSFNPDALIYCDLDRWVHWGMHHLAERTAAVDALSSQSGWVYACLGRSRRAFETHPRVQRETERITNRGASFAFGGRVDVTAGAAWMRRSAAELIVEKSAERSNATDGEWPSLIWKCRSDDLGQLSTNGLEFETATYYQAEIATAGGREAWEAKVYDTPRMWASRARLGADTLAAISRITGR